MTQNNSYSDTAMYDASRNWSDAQWARFLQCDKKEIPSIRNYINGKDDRGNLRFLAGVFIEKNKDKYDWWFHLAHLCYSSKKPFATYEEALNFSKNFITKFQFNRAQQKLLEVPRYAAMMMKIHGER